MFGKDEFIFSAKNGIAIVLSVLEIHNLYSLRRVGPIPSSLENKYIFVASRFHVKISKCTVNFVLHFASNKLPLKSVSCNLL